MTREDKVLYQIGWVLIALIFCLTLLLKIIPISLSSFFLPCIFHRFTGFYCPGCGGTRATIALFHGSIGKSFIDHPLVDYGAFIFSYYMISNTIERLSKGRFRVGFRYADKWVYLAHNNCWNQFRGQKWVATLLSNRFIKGIKANIN